jgi:hypothetical protein
MQDRYTIRLPGSAAVRRNCVLPWLVKRNDCMGAKAVEQFARYLKLEFHYDCTPFSARAYLGLCDGLRYPVHPYLLYHNRAGDRPVGALVMVKEIDIAPWLLAWVWLHPFARREGVLSSAWAMLCTQYDVFDVQQPISLAMQAFLRKTEG